MPMRTSRSFPRTERWWSRRAMISRPLAIGILIYTLLPNAAHAQSHTALDFDGVDDWVEFSGTVNFNAPFTVEAWILARSGVDGGRFISTRPTVSRAGVNVWEMDVVDNAGQFQLRFSLQGATRASAPFDAHMNAWTHVAGTWEGPSGAREVNLYIDGALVGTGTQPMDLPASNTSLVLGRTGLQMSSHFDGRVDEVRIFNAELDQPTIQAWMSSHVTPGHPGAGALVASWWFDEGSGQTVASDVNSPTMDGRLGDGAGADAADPAWVASEVVPIHETSVGGIKSRYR